MPPASPDLIVPMDQPHDDAGGPALSHWLTPLASSAGAALTACGGGASSASPAPPLITSGAITASQAARFLAQATLGFTRRELDELVKLKDYGAWIDAQFTAPTTTGHVDWLIAKGYNAATNINNTNGLDNTIWRKFISSPDALRQRMVLALSEICVVSLLGINGPWRQFSVARYLDILETHAFGNYRNLLRDITLSPAMGYYLTFRGNVKANPTTGSEPDENYAREIMQLFTIGLVKLNTDGTVQLRGGAAVETYAQADVSGLARVFTGWDLDVSGLAAPYPPDIQWRPMVQVPARYETGSKTFLGVTIPAGVGAEQSLATALDTLFNHPNTAPFISKQLIQRLVTSNPSPAYVGRVAAAFANNGSGVRGDLRAVLRAILLDAEARDEVQAAAPTFGKLREPMVRFLNWARAYRVTSPSDVWAVGDLSDPSSKLGQSPMRSVSVFNFFRPGYVPPGTELSARTLTGPEFQITNESTVAGYVNFMQRAVSGQGPGDLKADYSALLALAGDSAALVNEIHQVLACGQLSAAALGTIRAALDGMPAATDAGKQARVYAALTLVLAAPEFITQR